jgi:type I restriction-modification system DNA methylase subunit
MNTEPSFYRNQGLFSEIYLEQITLNPSRSDDLASFKVISDYRIFADRSNLNSWTSTYIHQVFAILGFSAISPTPGISLLSPMGEPNKKIAVCLVALPSQDLDEARIGRNLAAKTIHTMRDQNFKWGILTNGDLWRVYHLDEPTPYETYLEIDLKNILSEGSFRAYQIFHKFLKVANFLPTEIGGCQFDQLKKESQEKIDYIEKELSKALKQREEGGKGVLSDLCMGYVSQIKMQGQQAPSSDEDRQRIYHSAMLFMFRLLFLFYADARGLLSTPTQEEVAKVRGRADEVASLANDDRKGYSLWEMLANIFLEIDNSYNGGLFNPAESEFTEFIAKTRVQDQYLAGTIQNLVNYREKDGTQKLISYRDMSVRHLGTLYEGLLEHKLFIAEEDTQISVSKNKVQFIPASQGGRAITGLYIKAGEVYFAGDRGERKSSGSYYTPEYIVDHLVGNTVGVELKSLEKRFFEENQDLLISAGNANASPDEQKKLIDAAIIFVREKILDLTVLDPAMGSGHFLVNVTNLISNTICDFLNRLPVQGQAPSSPTYWRRWVVENCIYGVDLNPLAVELAKLSLWILSMAQDQPLSFMNHHLKCGNSLLGATLDEVGNYPLSKAKKNPLQFSLFSQDQDLRADIADVLKKSQWIATLPSTSLAEVEAKKKLLAEIEQEFERYKAVCDLHTGLFFGEKVDELTYQNIIQSKDLSLRKGPSLLLPHFHWELEFPEIFFKHGGFRVVVSNPPYDTIKEDDYFLSQPAAKTGNLFSHFIAKAVQVNQKDGHIGFVVPLSFACGSSFEGVRQMIYKNYDRLSAAHYSIRPTQLFEGVVQRITIFHSNNKLGTNKCLVFTSKLWRWKKEDQEFVVRNPELSFVGSLSNGVIPKVYSNIGSDIYNFLRSSKIALSSIILDKEEEYNSIAYYHAASGYWIKAYDFIPYFKRERETSSGISTKLKTLHFKSALDKNIFLLLINSSLFYFWWIAISNQFDVQLNEVKSLGLANYSLFVQKESEIKILVDRLMTDLNKNSKVKNTTMGGKKAEYQEFYPRKSIHLIHQIDDFLASIYGLTPEQNEFLKNYDLEWRTDAEQEL